MEKAKIVTLLKPEKEALCPKNDRPVSLLCHTYKLYERIFLNRLTHQVEKN